MMHVFKISLLIIFANTFNCNEPTFAYDFEFVSPYNNQADPVSFNHTNIISAVKQNDHKKLASYKSYFETRNSTDQRALLQNIDFDSLKHEVYHKIKVDRLEFNYRPQNILIGLFIYLSLIKYNMSYRFEKCATNYFSNYLKQLVNEDFQSGSLSSLSFLINEDYFLLFASLVVAYIARHEYLFLPAHQTMHYLNYFEEELKKLRQSQ